MKTKTSRTLEYALLAAYAFLVWSPVLKFEFLRAYEPLWLGGARHEFNFLELYRSHSYFYFLDYKLFGWDPRGWYLTGIAAHIAGSLAFVALLRKMLEEFAADLKLDHFVTVFGFIFIGSYVYLDAVSWGSFNSYYGVLLFLESVSVLQFLKAEKERRALPALLSALTYFAALLIRETAVFTVVLVACVVLLRAWRREGTAAGAAAKEFVLKLAPYVGVTALFIVFRHAVGGIGGDMNDENVRGRLTLLANKQYFELAWRIGVTFFRNVPTLFIPFRWLNDFQFWLEYKHGGNQFLAQYLFSTIGIAVYVPMTAVCLWRFLKKDALGSVLALAWTIITFSLLLIALAIPMTDAVMHSPYDYFTRRYNYVAFLGAGMMWAALVTGFASLWKESRRRNALLAATACVLAFNFVVLRSMLRKVYRTEHAAYKDFMAAFKKVSRDFNDKTLIYYHPLSTDINDYLLAMGLTKSWVYKETGAQDSTSVNCESQLDRVFQKLSEKRVDEKDVVFLSYSKPTGLVNYTDKVLDFYRRETRVPLKVNAATDLAAAGPLYAEIPYAVELEFDEGDTRSLGDGEFPDFAEWYRGLAVKTGPTISQRAGEPFRYFAPENAADFNFGNGFYWGADGFESYVELAAAAPADIYGLWVLTPAKVYTPSVFTVTYRGDHQAAYDQSVEPWGLLVTFKEKVTAKKIRLNIQHTYENYALISEMNIITKSILNFLGRGKNVPALLDRIRADASSRGFWAKVDCVLADGDKKVAKTVWQFVDFGGPARRRVIPFAMNDAEWGGVDKFLSVKYESVRVTVPEKVLGRIRIRKLNFVNKYQ